jgi:hypothetical protein
VPQRIKEVLITYTESIFSFNTDPSVFVARWQWLDVMTRTSYSTKVCMHSTEYCTHSEIKYGYLVLQGTICVRWNYGRRCLSF